MNLYKLIYYRKNLTCEQSHKIKHASDLRLNKDIVIINNLIILIQLIC